MSQAAPRSATDYRINLVGLAFLLVGVAAVIRFELDPVPAVSLLMALTAAPILLLDVLVHRVHRRPTTGLDWSRPRPRDLRRIATRWLGGLAALAPIFLLYALAPEYRGAFYDDFYAFLGWFGPAALVGTAVYLAWIDRWLAEPRDTYWAVGAALTGQAPPSREAIGQALRTWLVKGFFVPLMFVYAVHNITALQHHVLESDRETYQRVFDASWSLLFLIDVVFTTMGYLTTLRVFDTHVRSAEPTMQGWVVALCCYQPFFDLMFKQYLLYESGPEWWDLLAAYPGTRVVWGVVLLLLLAVFSGSTVAFGCRFSNLTHRGVVTNGPYRWTRHPAYVSKCVMFWLMFVPFVYRGSAYEVVRDCTWLLALCGIYWLRARTEERHLSRDPAYVAYATWMNDRSLFAPLGRWFPFLAYRQPA